MKRVHKMNLKITDSFYFWHVMCGIVKIYHVMLVFGKHVLTPLLASVVKADFLLPLTSVLDLKP